MYGLSGLFTDTAFLPQVGIEHLEIAERDIGGYDIEFRVFKALSGYRLEPCRYRVCIVMQEREDKPRDAVLFKGVAVRAGHCHRQETAYSCARFEQ